MLIDDNNLKKKTFTLTLLQTQQIMDLSSSDIIDTQKLEEKKILSLKLTDKLNSSKLPNEFQSYNE